MEIITNHCSRVKFLYNYCIQAWMPEIISDSEEDIEIVEKIQRGLREQLNPFLHRDIL